MRQNSYPSIRSATCIDYLVAVRICTYFVAVGATTKQQSAACEIYMGVTS